MTTLTNMDAPIGGPPFDVVGWAVAENAPLLFQRFDPATRKPVRSVVGLVMERVDAASFADALGNVLADPEGLPSLIFAGHEILTGDPGEAPGGFPSHLVLRLARHIEVDHVTGEAVLVAEDRSRTSVRPFSAPRSKETVPRGRPSAIAWEHDVDFATYAGRVEAIRTAIDGGGVKGAVLSVGMQRPTNARPFDIYRHFVATNPSSFGYVLDVGGHALIGSSPLAFLTSRGRRLHLETDAGTRPVVGDPAANTIAEADLATNPKDATEHAIVVEAEREALGSIARDGSVETVIDRQVRRFSHVMHLYTALEADLAEGLNLADAILALAPAAAVSGWPKRAAARHGVAAEGAPRGPYGGVIGIVDPRTGDSDLAVVIRSLWLADGVARLRTGGKIVRESIATAEYQECLAKAKFLIEGVAAAEAGLTGR